MEGILLIKKHHLLIFGMRLSAEENQSGKIPVDNSTDHAEYSFHGKKKDSGVFSAVFSSALVQTSRCRIRINVVETTLVQASQFSAFFQKKLMEQ